MLGVKLGTITPEGAGGKLPHFVDFDKADRKTSTVTLVMMLKSIRNWHSI